MREPIWSVEEDAPPSREWQRTARRLGVPGTEPLWRLPFLRRATVRVRWDDLAAVLVSVAVLVLIFIGFRLL